MRAARRRELTEVQEERCPEVMRAAWARWRMAGLAAALAATAASQEEGWEFAMGEH